MTNSDKDRGMSKRMVQMSGDGKAQISYLVAGRSGDRVTLCAICTVHMEMRSVSFLVEPQNQGQRFFGLCFKIDSSDLIIWVSKSPCQFFFWFGPQN
jgi:hypothetical protein